MSRNVKSVEYNGQVYMVGDRVMYIPNHENDCRKCGRHQDIEYVRISSIKIRERVSGGFINSRTDIVDIAVWVKYDKIHPEQPGQRTPIENLQLLFLCEEGKKINL